MTPSEQLLIDGKPEPEAFRAHAKRNDARVYRALVMGVVVTYLVLAIGSSLTKLPWCDEAWFSTPGLNLITNGSMGTPVLERTEPGMDGIDQYTYWAMPLHLISQAGWFKIFGFHLFTIRAHSIVWGLVLLASWFFIMKSLSQDRGVALLTLFLLAIDTTVISRVSEGRMDIMCAALGFAGFAAYLQLRERNLTLAILISNILVAAGCITHPNGILAFFGLIFLTLYFDRRRIQWRHVPIAIVPYLLFAAGWGLYILEAPALFLIQMRANAAGRFAGLTAPLEAFLREINERYLANYGLGQHWAGPVVRLKLVLLLAYVVGIIGAILTRGIRQHKGYRALLILTALYFTIMSLYEGFKYHMYLIYSIPLFAALFAVWIHWVWRNRSIPSPVLAVCLAGFLSLQVGGSVYAMIQDPYRKTYMPVVNFLKANSNENTLIMGSAELGFELGFFNGRLIDDVRLGYYSGKRPDFIVVDRRYADYFDWLRKEPGIRPHIDKLFSDDYRQVFEQDTFKIYARR